MKPLAEWKKLLPVGFAGLLAGACASLGPGSGLNPLGGGVRIQEIENGIYYLVSASNSTYWKAEETAQRLWHEKAVSLCGEGHYREIAVTEYTHWVAATDTTVPVFDADGRIGGNVTARSPELRNGNKDGFVVCSHVTLTDKEILQKIGKSVE